MVLGLADWPESSAGSDVHSVIGNENARILSAGGGMSRHHRQQDRGRDEANHSPCFAPTLGKFWGIYIDVSACHDIRPAYSKDAPGGSVLAHMH